MSIDPKDSQDLPAEDLEISTDDAESVKGGARTRNVEKRNTERAERF